MAKPTVLVLRAPGTNCDEETAYAFEQAGANVERIHVNRLVESPECGSDFQILCFPGGFSYGDDIAAGRILAQRLNVHLSDLVNSFRESDRLVLGICNGFQVMMRLGIFFPKSHYQDADEKPPATLTWNQQARFEDRWVNLKCAADNPSPFLTGIESMYLPMAHAEGRFVGAGDEALDQLRNNNQLCLAYSTENGETGDETLPFPVNPNGADRNVAGICDPSGRIFGLMPHPERHIDPTHHPAWTRRDSQPSEGEGLQVFRNAVNYFG
ncbi:MAG: phosphoribosylformylglycinamidine synthase subunit PurQ [Aureliella sp.]